jgi:hypothetical protein
MSARLHSVIACLLALLYGLVGATGEARHYLVAELELPGAEHSQDGSDEGYWHTHEPDHHWHHHHGHSHKVPAHQGTVNSKSCAKCDWGGIALRAPLGAHTPHACPLLTVLSTLKLSHATKAVLPDGPSGCSEFLPRCEHCSPVLLVRHALARGPPAALSA